MEIEFKNVTKNYGKRTVLHNLNFSIKENTVVGLVGPNGVGKSTLLRLLAGVLIPNSGEICCSTKDAYENWARSNTFFVVSGERGLRNKLTIRENVLYFSALKGSSSKLALKRLNKYAETMNLTELLNKTYESMSTGQKKISAILVGVSLNTAYLLMDEPSNGLDLNAKKYLATLIKSLDQTVVISSHDPELLSDVSTHYLFFNNGSIIDNIHDTLNEKEVAEMYHKYCDYEEELL